MNLAETLANLPGTADGIAAHLRERGIRGVPADSYCCVIANFLKEKGFDSASVGDHRIEAFRVTDGDDEFDWVATPRPVKDFLKQFDSHQWPDLIGGGDR